VPQIIKQSATVVNFLGALQQKAPAQTAITDSLVHQIPEDPEWVATLAMSATIVTQMRDIQTLAQSLPEINSQVRPLRPIIQLKFPCVYGDLLRRLLLFPHTLGCRCSNRFSTQVFQQDPHERAWQA
jgi:hypothetical protein